MVEHIVLEMLEETADIGGETEHWVLFVGFITRRCSFSVLMNAFQTDNEVLIEYMSPVDLLNFFHRRHSSLDIPAVGFDGEFFAVFAGVGFRWTRGFRFAQWQLVGFLDDFFRFHIEGERFEIIYSQSFTERFLGDWLFRFVYGRRR